MNLQKNVSLSSSMADTLARQIEEGVFPAGTKLPSIREYAEASGCSKNTVISAFETLTANGLIEPRRGSGFYVARQVKAAAEPEDARVLDRAMDTVWLMREQLQVKPAVLNLGEGFPPIDWLEGTRLDQYHQRVVRTGVASLFRYGSRYGYLPLRQSLQQKLSGYEIDAPPSQIVLTHGANQAMDLVLRYFVRPGDAVLVDDPGYYPLFGKLKLSGANIIGVPREVDGPNLAELERCMVEHRPKLFFTQSVGHNPTGTDTSAAKAYRILQLAEHHDTVIVENDAFADLRPRSLTRIATLDQLRRTIYIGSFSKSVSAALRVGFLACNAALASDLADVKMLIHVSSSEYSERTLAAIVSDGHFMRHTNQLQEKLRRATAAGKNVLKKVGASIFKESDQSMYLWASLPGWPDSMKLAKAMLNHGVILAPGAVFSPTSDKVSPYCRFNVGYLSDERFLSALLLATR
ncbi:PLP-dependent aminotransferase family protein [bacterium M00.F.Ca.ET.228.01.1.1]|uniref:Transcriptional regulator, GntR family with aminotransferase domain n=1 Tax=Burkholderia sp. (strain CCGE1003) TaxID=640512 RepID=E1TEK1_BURSG|nr:PLP-dependent aminotransferase family protein [Paraburkholderia phenoliruptrix]TGP45803.1 PLP-dependent aminotransferase family protein [bacterium M00.F.Ca.ET.228.01.1.1]TGS04285.1 PLP-dependent aminotransferase family protein [bacterium M00.F.Ca.ET.191.01.1.1]TGU07096.1 PLP-dependent aminotransferase family protein [bacterium M00.F.Ca.ET.155.01.1.1]MBW0448488.1 PLP-dependent aminotransferase family protein [Paraburkholderia phenoliruptrix]MBW9100650.1 PLP-dependent aminotransferase family 